MLVICLVTYIYCVFFYTHTVVSSIDKPRRIGHRRFYFFGV